MQYIHQIIVDCVFFKNYRVIASRMLTKQYRPELFDDSVLFYCACLCCRHLCECVWSFLLGVCTGLSAIYLDIKKDKTICHMAEYKVSQVWHIYLTTTVISVFRRLWLDRQSYHSVVVGYIIDHYYLNYYSHLILKHAFVRMKYILTKGVMQ
jgi:hypothetical protein